MSVASSLFWLPVDTHSIRWTFAITCSEEVPFGIDTKIRMVMAQIHEQFAIFILASTSIRKVVTLQDVVKFCFQIFQEQFIRTDEQR